MKATGNGALDVCVNNLLRVVRGEVPYDRIKGINSGVIDTPYIGSADTLAADADWVVEKYEPRARLEGVSIVPNGAENGGFAVIATVKEREG